MSYQVDFTWLFVAFIFGGVVASFWMTMTTEDPLDTERVFRRWLYALVLIVVVSVVRR